MVNDITNGVKLETPETHNNISFDPSVEVHLNEIRLMSISGLGRSAKVYFDFGYGDDKVKIFASWQWQAMVSSCLQHLLHSHIDMTDDECDSMQVTRNVIQKLLDSRPVIKNRLED